MALTPVTLKQTATELKLESELERTKDSKRTMKSILDTIAITLVATFIIVALALFVSAAVGVSVPIPGVVIVACGGVTLPCLVVGFGFVESLNMLNDAYFNKKINKLESKLREFPIELENPCDPKPEGLF